MEKLFHSNSLVMSIRKIVILKSFTCYQKYIKVSKKFLIEQWFLYVARELRMYQNFLITILNH